jgi:hypothetical protein
MADRRADGEPQSGLLVLLLGGRPPALFFLAAHLQPAVIAVIASRDSTESLSDVQQRLRRLLPAVRLAADRIVPPYSMSATADAIQAVLDERPDLTPAISLTGAPLPMSIAGYQAALRCGCPAYYINTRDSEVLDLTAPEEAAPLLVRIAIADYLAFYGLALDQTAGLAARQTGGHWLEQHVWQIARALRHAGQPLFDECQRSMHFNVADAGREVDFIGVRRGMALIASCKTGKDARNKQHLDELEAVGKKLGGDYCVRLYITDQVRQPPPANQTDPWEQFLAQARSARSVVVTGAELPNLGEILKREMLTPTFPRR